ncbi:protein AAR2 homolog [Microplitis mediator]|uniref:protein AAR2 homolog n=1 Tax=Microplitis mediator TaxID=375433 RepID=UPI002554B6BF|nr:protein AAR2 homolog [Microplitis mediator]
MESKKSCEMNQEVAKYLFKQGGTLIVLDMSPGTDFGIDLKSWTTGSNFKGIKMIPPGLHFIHYSATNEFNESVPRVGFFHVFKEKDFIVKQWDKKEEDMSSLPIEDELVERLKTNHKELDKFLGPYPYEMLNQWKELTDKIDDNILERCLPLSGFVRSALELENYDNEMRLKENDKNKQRRRESGLSVEAKEELLLPNLKAKKGTELRFTEIPERNYPDDATPAEITEYSLDSTYALNATIQKMKDQSEIIGELQLAFVCFLVGQSLEAFEHWKKLIALICGAEKAISNRRSIYVDFLHIIEIQLSHAPEDILCDIVSSNNFVYHHLRKLFATIEINPEIEGRLKSEATRLQTRLTNKFSWDFSNLQEEEFDEAPVVVAID